MNGNVRVPVFPEYITVHLGAASTPAQNVTVPFAEYIKNVASSEIYPTWPEEALRANILAQTSFALNRIYTEYYRSRGYDFDITNSTASDQSYVYGRDVFANVGAIVDSLYPSYLSRAGSVEPLFAAYCDGVEVKCDGLSQWGSVSLAEQGYSAEDILKNYYGSDVEIITNVPVENISESYPGVVLRPGISGNDVELIQKRLNRIARNYPSIPKISAPVGVYNEQTENAVRRFQQIFNLTPDGLVGRATWYKIARIYNAVKRLSELDSEGIDPYEVTTGFSTSLSVGDRGAGVENLQYFLSFISNFDPSVPPVKIDGIFGPATREAVMDFQQAYNLEVTGVVELKTWDRLYRTYLGMLASLPDGYFDGVTSPYPGAPLAVGSEGDAVLDMQRYLNFIAGYYPDIPRIEEDGLFGPATLEAVNAFRRIFGLTDTSPRVAFTTWDAITREYERLYQGERNT